MTINSSTLLSDTVIAIRNDLRNNIVDPLATSRPDGEKFVMTSYPKRNIIYPLITIKGKVVGDKPLGQQSNQRLVSLSIEVRVWARNVKERDVLNDSVYYRMKQNNFPASTSNTWTNLQLFDFGLNSTMDIEPDIDGEEVHKDRIMIFRYAYIAT